jgi:branched-chain amino acid transport system ATP-binding protein
MTNNKEILRTENLVKNFGGVCALKNVNFRLSEGELRAIIGPNGAGKTTLVSLINGRLKPTEGKIYFRGEDITGLTSNRISHKGVGSTFQQSNLFPNLSVFQNIRLAVQSRDKQHSNPFKDVDSITSLSEKTRQILDLLHMTGKSGYPAASLSHGDQRLLEIGIALGTSPELLILDEPTAGMSIKETLEMGEVIDDLARSKTILLIEHDVDLVMKLADAITVLDKGSIVVEGAPEKISSNKKVQEVYLGVS